MKRVIALVVVLVCVLSVALVYRLRQLGAYRNAPAGGTGTIEGTEINVTTRISARVVAVHVREGDAVKAGQLLVELDCAEPEAALAQAKAQLAASEAGVQSALAQVRAADGSTAVARRSVKAVRAEEATAVADRANTEKEAARVKSLHEAGAVASAQLDRAETSVVGANERVAQVQANQEAAVARVSVAYQDRVAAAAHTQASREQVEAARANVARAETTVKECRLYAPRDAVVQIRSYEPGEVVLPGANLLSLVYLDEVRATFYLPNAELGAAAPNKPVTVIADAYPGQRFSGLIRRVSSEAEFTPKTVQTREDRDRLVYAVEVTLPNPARKLRPGMPVEVSINGTGR
jgi:HlyD family secretion protein